LSKEEEHQHDNAFGFALRIAREEVERKLFIDRIFYIGIKRNWHRGSKVIFVKRSLSGDSFVGSAVVERFVLTNHMSDTEQRLCTTNNWYGKIVFRIVTKFLPAVSVEASAGAGGNRLLGLQTGEQVPTSEIEKISQMASARLTS
jgi:hypothetical protein